MRHLSVSVRVCPWLCILFLSFPAFAQSENDFYRYLLKKPVATQEEAVRSVARFKGYHGADNMDEELRFLDGQGVKFSRTIRSIGRQPVTKGEAAKMFLNAMRDAADQRGLLGRIFTGSRRFAARDGMAQKLLPKDSFANEFMSGAELLTMLGRAVEQTEKKP